MNEFLIAFRETLESALIVGIIFTFLTRIGQTTAIRYLWLGVGGAAASSLALGAVLYYAQDYAGDLKPMFEGLFMYLAAGFLLYMVVWMSRNSNIKQKIENESATAAAGNFMGVFALAYFGVLREGFETVLFLFASATQSGGFSFVGFFLGMGLAIGAGYLIFRQGVKVPIKKLFNYSSVALIVLAAGMVAYGTHELEDFIVERKVFPALTEDAVLRPWDILEPTKREPASATFYTYNAEKQRYVHWLHDSGAVGVYLKGFFGYNSNPNYLEVFLWALTLLGGLYAWRRLSQAPPPKPAAS